jgi:hypothetical protein
MCGLPVFPPKPKRENPARTRRTFRLIAAWVRGALLARSALEPSARVCSPTREESHSDHD